MKKLFLIAALLVIGFSNAQVGIGTNSPNISAALDITSTSKGFLLPRLTYAQKAAITSPPSGLQVWCTDCGTSGELQFFNGTIWKAIDLVSGSFARPDAPTSPIATPGNAQASVAFTDPASNGGSAITLYTVTDSTLSFTASGTNSPLIVTGLTNGTSYTFTVVATNAMGNSVTSVTSNSVIPLLAVGDNLGGGKVAYILRAGDPNYNILVQHGLIAALSDNSSGMSWITGNPTQSTLNGNTQSIIGTGQANTNFMIAQSGYTGGAARVCDDYINIETGTGVYSDWFLPSKDELTKLYNNKILIGGFNISFPYYWSSTEYSATDAYFITFDYGLAPNISKTNGAPKVRAVRSF